MGSSWQLSKGSVNGLLAFQNPNLYNQNDRCSVSATLTAGEGVVHSVCRFVLTSELETYQSDAFILLRCQSGATDLPADPAQNFQFAADLEIQISWHGVGLVLTHKPNSTEANAAAEATIKFAKEMPIENLHCAGWATSNI